MREPFEEVTVVRLGGRGGGWRAVVAVALAIGVSVALIGTGAFFRTPTVEPAPPISPSARVADATAAPLPTRAPSTILPNEDISTENGEFAIRSAGYRVAYSVDESHQPEVLEDGALAIFGFGERSQEGSDENLVAISVGTPAIGARILQDSRVPRVYATTLDDLEAAYSAAVGTSLGVRGYLPIDGREGRIFEPQGGPPIQTGVAFAIHGNRAFVIVSTSPGLLRNFVGGIRFGPMLFVSRTLGFQVPQPLGPRPFGTEVGIRPAPVTGLYLFDDGEPIAQDTYSHAIGVSVGTESRPALVRVVPSGHQPPQPRRIWAATLPELVASYLGAAGPGADIRPTVLGGEQAVLILGSDGLAATVLAVHEGRSYLVMTSGRLDIEPAPHFQTFLDTFSFL